jgi:hypothetical protein
VKHSILIAVLVLLTTTVVAGGRVPTTYNQRYQALFAEQEMFRKRPELLGCVLAARDTVQTDASAVFNKLRFTSKSVQGGYVVEGVVQDKNFRTVRIHGEGRVRAYSFLENWEEAEITCRFIAGVDPVIRIWIAE